MVSNLKSNVSNLYTMSTGNMNLTLKVWRQKSTKDTGKMVDYKVSNISPDMSFLEMFDVLNFQNLVH